MTNFWWQVFFWVIIVISGGSVVVSFGILIWSLPPVQKWRLHRTMVEFEKASKDLEEATERLIETVKGMTDGK